MISPNPPPPAESTLSTLLPLVTSPRWYSYSSIIVCTRPRPVGFVYTQTRGISYKHRMDLSTRLSTRPLTLSLELVLMNSSGTCTIVMLH